MKSLFTYFICMISRTRVGSDNDILSTPLTTYLQPRGVATSDPQSIEDNGGLQCLLGVGKR